MLWWFVQVGGQTRVSCLYSLKLLAATQGEAAAGSQPCVLSHRHPCILQWPSEVGGGMVPFSCFTAEETQIHRGMGRNKYLPSKSVAEARQEDCSLSGIEPLYPAQSCTS